MRKEDILHFLDRKVFVEVDNGFHYSGFLESVNEDSITLIDKKVGVMIIDIDKISLIRGVDDAGPSF